MKLVILPQTKELYKSMDDDIQTMRERTVWTFVSNLAKVTIINNHSVCTVKRNKKIRVIRKKARPKVLERKKNTTKCLAQ